MERCDGIGVVDDEALADAFGAAVAGDVPGFEAVWTTVHPTLLRYLRVLVGPAAEDVASATWSQVARDLPRFQGDLVGFRVWLFRLARSLGTADRRRMRRRGAEPGDPAAVGAGPDPASGALDTRWALEVIASLPRVQAEAVTLRVVAGLDVAQTAQVLGRRPGAVRTAATRGLRRLANHPGVRDRAGSAGETGPLDSAQPEGV
jgi:RNA polymerase sigma-70 factor, ECF subfamily